jgi:hypothetical protein
LDVPEPKLHGEFGPAQFLADVGGMAQLRHPPVLDECPVERPCLPAFDDVQELVVIAVVLDQDRALAGCGRITK